MLLASATDRVLRHSRSFLPERHVAAYSSNNVSTMSSTLSPGGLLLSPVQEPGSHPVARSQDSIDLAMEVTLRRLINKALQSKGKGPFHHLSGLPGVASWEDESPRVPHGFPTPPLSPDSPAAPVGLRMRPMSKDLGADEREYSEGDAIRVDSIDIANSYRRGGGGGRHMATKGSAPSPSSAAMGQNCYAKPVDGVVVEEQAEETSRWRFLNGPLRRTSLSVSLPTEDEDELAAVAAASPAVMGRAPVPPAAGAQDVARWQADGGGSHGLGVANRRESSRQQTSGPASGFEVGECVLVRCNKSKWQQAVVRKETGDGVRLWVVPAQTAVDVPLELVPTHLARPPPAGKRHDSAPQQQEQQPQPPPQGFVKRQMHAVRHAHLAHRQLYEKVEVTASCSACGHAVLAGDSLVSWAGSRTTHLGCAARGPSPTTTPGATTLSPRYSSRASSPITHVLDPHPWGYESDAEAGGDPASQAASPAARIRESFAHQRVCSDELTVAVDPMPGPSLRPCVATSAATHLGPIGPFHVATTLGAARAAAADVADAEEQWAGGGGDASKELEEGSSVRPGGASHSLLGSFPALSVDDYLALAGMDPQVVGGIALSRKHCQVAAGGAAPAAAAVPGGAGGSSPGGGGGGCAHAARIGGSPAEASWSEMHERLGTFRKLQVAPREAATWQHPPEGPRSQGLFSPGGRGVEGSRVAGGWGAAARRVPAAELWELPAGSQSSMGGDGGTRPCPEDGRSAAVVSGGALQASPPGGRSDSWQSTAAPNRWWTLPLGGTAALGAPGGGMVDVCTSGDGGGRGIYPPLLQSLGAPHGEWITVRRAKLEVM